MSNELLEKVISTSTIGAGPGDGLLRPDQTDRFIDYMWDATTLGSQVRTERLKGNEAELNRIAVGERLVRLATEAVDDAVNAKVAFSKVSISTEKFRMDWELSTESLEDNIEGEALEDHIARLMAAQAANDLEDLAINGDSLGSSDDALLKGFDGWRKRLYAGANVVDAAGADLDFGVFNKALRSMPRRYMDRRGSLRFFTAAGLLQDFAYSAMLVQNTYVEDPAAARAAAGRTNVAGPQPGWSPGSPFGIRAEEVPLFPEYETGGGLGSDIWLTDPKNLVWAVKREIKVYREFVPRKDTIEYTMFTRVGAAVENAHAAVLVKNVAYTA